MKEKIKNFLASKWGTELKSATVTFSAIFIGSLVITPAFNSLVGTDFPTIQQLKDVVPVLADTLYRSLWITLLTETGLIKYRNK